MTKKKHPLRWRKQPNETGLQSVGQTPRGYDLRCDGETVARVRPLMEFGTRDFEGWYWYAQSDRFGIPLRNSATTPVKTVEEAKLAAKAYVRRHFTWEEKR